jgi:hypothetical protein
MSDKENHRGFNWSFPSYFSPSDQFVCDGCGGVLAVAPCYRYGVDALAGYSTSRSSACIGDVGGSCSVTQQEMGGGDMSTGAPLPSRLPEGLKRVDEDVEGGRVMEDGSEATEAYPIIPSLH